MALAEVEAVVEDVVAEEGVVEADTPVEDVREAVDDGLVEDWLDFEALEFADDVFELDEDAPVLPDCAG